MANRIRRSGFMEYRASLRLDVGRSDHLGPFFGFVGDELAKLAGRARNHHSAQVGEPRLYLGIREARIDLLVELIDDFSRRVLGRADAVPVTRFVAANKIAHNWDVWQRLRTRRGGHRQGAQSTGLDIFHRGSGRAEVDLHLAAKEIGERGRRATIWNVHHVDTGHHLEHLAGHVGRGSVASVCHYDPARICSGIGDELRHRLGRNRWIYEHHDWLAAEYRERCDVTNEVEIELDVVR